MIIVIIIIIVFVIFYYDNAGERMEHGIEKAHVLTADESLVLQCTTEFIDKMFKGNTLCRYHVNR